MDETNFEHGEQLDEILRVFEKQRANRARMAGTSAKERIEKLKRLRDELLASRHDLQKALFDDFRKNPGEADLTEIYPVVTEINHAVKHLARWMKPKRVKKTKALIGTSSSIRYEPKGVVLILSPWNYPVNLCLNPLVASIAAGNCTILKPSSKVPHTARFIKDLVSKIFPQEEVALFEGSSAVADSLLDLEFDHIVFTGSPRIGKNVMAKAAKHLTPVTLELGGKSPVIVDETADIDKAAERIVWAKFLNGGQTCVAPDYLLIHEDRLEAFVEAARRVLEKWYGESPEERQRSESLCRLVGKMQQVNLKNLLDSSIAAGAKVAFGGRTDTDNLYIEPTLLTDVDESSPIMEAEIFGPILPILTFGELDRAIELIQRGEKPLAVYIFSRSRANTDCILENTSSGGACVNSLVIQFANPNLPFGGVGQSGMGSYHGWFGFRSLTHERAVIKQGLPDTVRLFYPPYTDRVKALILKAIKYLS